MEGNTPPPQKKPLKTIFSPIINNTKIVIYLTFLFGGWIGERGDNYIIFVEQPSFLHSKHEC